MIGKILIEINRLKNELDGYSAKEGLDYIKSYINTLSKQQVKEPDKSLEEAAEISFDEAGALTEDYRDFLAKGLTENKPRPIGPHWFCEYAKNRFIVGAKWQKEQMLKDAYVESQIVEDGRIELEGDPLPCLNPIILLSYPQFKPGDKVRIIIIKED